MADPPNSVWGVRIKPKPRSFLLSLAGWTTWWTRVVGQESERKNLPNPKQTSNYHLKLTGWNTWWTRVTRVGRDKMKQTKLESTRTKAENIKKNFISKYFLDTVKTVTDQRTHTHTHRQGADDEQLAEECSNDIFNGRSTPKRKLILDTNEGKFESPGKKQRLEKFKSTLQFWEQGQTSTTLQYFNSSKQNSIHGLRVHQASDTDSD